MSVRKTSVASAAAIALTVAAMGPSPRYVYDGYYVRPYRQYDYGW